MTGDPGMPAVPSATVSRAPAPGPDRSPDDDALGPDGNLDLLLGVGRHQLEDWVVATHRYDTLPLINHHPSWGD